MNAVATFAALTALQVAPDDAVRAMLAAHRTERPRPVGRVVVWPVHCPREMTEASWKVTTCQ